MKFAVVTFGCRVNQADSLQIEETLRHRGGEPCAAEAADLVVVNTCSVTATADQGARQTMRRIARENPAARIVATGCYATRRPEDLAALPNVVAVVRNADKSEVWREAGLTTGERSDGDGPCGAALVPGIAGRTAFTLRVQTGCEEACAYCIIPATRGAAISVPVDQVLRDVRRLADAGFHEVILTGVHLGSYGRDLPGRSSLVRLLDALNSADVDLTFRISSLEPMDCSREIVDLVAGSERRFAPHFHLPLQHGSDRMLQAMRRPYSAAYYRELVEGIVERLPHASIGSDVIVGFPGESDEDFAATTEYLSSSPLSHLHVFPYSDRPGTAASRLPEKVEGPVVRERGRRVREIGALLSRRFRAAQIGTVRPALTLEDGSVAVTDNYLKVRIEPGLPRNTRIRVRVSGDGPSAVVSEVQQAAR